MFENTNTYNMEENKMNEIVTYKANNNGVNDNNFNIDNIMNILGQTSQIVKSNTEATSAIMLEINSQKNIIGGISKMVNEMGNNISNLSDRMCNIELSEEITTSQNENIQYSVKCRIREILGDSDIDTKKYYRIFAQRLYGNARRNAGMGSSLARTKKRDYQRVIDYIESWTPTNGCMGLKAEADRKAVARLIAKQQGYDC